MRLRSYTSEDKAECLRIFESNIPQFFAEEERPEFTSFLDRLMPSCFEPLTHPYFIVEDNDGKITASGGYRLCNNHGLASITWLQVECREQRRGIGSFLLLNCLRDLCQTEFVTRVNLSTSQHVYTFYERLGFILVSTIPNGFTHGLDRYDMALTLDTRCCRNIKHRLTSIIGEQSW